ILPAIRETKSSDGQGTVYSSSCIKPDCKKVWTILEVRLGRLSPSRRHPIPGTCLCWKRGLDVILLHAACQNPIGQPSRHAHQQAHLPGKAVELSPAAKRPYNSPSGLVRGY